MQKLRSASIISCSSRRISSRNPRPAVLRDSIYQLLEPRGMLGTDHLRLVMSLSPFRLSMVLLTVVSPLLYEPTYGCSRIKAVSQR